ncbi:MAG: hypothetical protein MI806_25940 [Minwuiales bacterium]|nr:hypothetical protein [Minwuiales bacterium]
MTAVGHDADRLPLTCARGVAIWKVENFIERQGIEPEQFGRRAVGDAEFVAKLKHRPADLTMADVERAETFIAEFPKFRAPDWARRYWQEVQRAPAKEIEDV